ncbi:MULTISPECIES: universal stress protein [unclassified Pseudomonas]|uniref:universal stress protein n=1 Tax=unclassified Pseudomonas TaxID=196821 RepID=UPI001CF9BFE7|nr:MULTISPECIES: universal stress protein [unclassified Pseudomonas]WLH76915.1 universal stress protein [Pseudomonas sp. FP2335]
MSQIPRLLLIAPSAMTHTPAFERAAALAQALRQPLHIVAFDYLQALAVADLFAPEQIAAVRDAYLEKHRHWLEEQASRMREYGVTVTSEVVWVRDPYAEILHFIKEMPLTMIIKDAREESVLKRVFYTPLDWQLLRDCPVPVHLVTNAQNPHPRRILAIIDVLRSEDQDLVFNDQILAAASKLAEVCNAQVEVLHAYDWTAAYTMDMGFGALPLATGIYEAEGVAQREAFAAIAERHGVAADCRHFIEGVPVPVICQFVEQHQVDVIVAGTVQHKGLSKLLGTTAEQLLHRAPCSLLAIKPGRGL